MQTHIIREANIEDISQIQIVRHSVKENVLSNPSLVTDKDCEEFVTIRGKGWVCEVDGKIQGFAIADLKESNIWALFIHPDYEKMGIGTQLQNQMLEWYFGQGKEKVWLSTEKQSRAETFYRKLGWKESEILSNNEIKFEMTMKKWEAIKQTSY
ncbi:GNAT family N-acetyltransferase [Bernardetia sp.]|uniref:GNAT family N-acetyltransferase n=1 Tax=Bernardetia sp. TaxID=1937974 RepID=UPI0025C2DB43|nr:GNAT family N-acetyltransferase [Bernardetia sp.]